jgi:hypothetical protein
MNYNKLTVIFLILLLLGFSNCSEDFLDVNPTSSLGESELSSESGLEGTLIAAYSSLLGRRGFYSDASNWFWGSVLGGEANKGTNAGDQSQVNEIMVYNPQTNNGSIFEKYSTTYEGVARSNAVLKLVAVARENGTAPAATLTRIEAEARFLRAHYYFDLKKIFGDVPYVDETWDELTPVANNQNLYPFIEADFQFAFDNLPGTMPDAGRANKWAAGAYLGKVYLFQSKWQEASSILENVIQNGTTANGEPYGLLENYSMAFRSTFDNSRESVFASQAAVGTGTIENANPAMVLNFPNGSAGPERPGGCCGFFQPSFELVNSFRTDANGLPLLDGSYNDPSNEVKNDQGLFSADAFTPDEGPVDPRLDHSVGRRGIPYLDWGPHPGFDWIRDQAYAGPFSPKKFIYYRAGIGSENDGSSWTPGYTAVNYNIIRFADVLLMAAEAAVETNNLSRAVELVNIVRNRAAASTIVNSDGSPAANYVISPYSSFGSQQEARDAVRFERKLELSGEGHRLYDLVRWGVAAEEINAFLAHDRQFLNVIYSGANFTSPKSELLPIPQNEIDLQGTDVLSQNPGY